MKRILCALLCVLMLLSLTACASEQDKTLESAAAMIAEGKYQEAYDALTGLESYTTYQAQVDAAMAGIQEAQGAFLLNTTWKEINSALEMTFLEDGTVQYAFDIYPAGPEKPDGEWNYKDGALTVVWIPGLAEDAESYTGPVTIEERDGVTHLVAGELDFVREEDYGPYVPIAVEITSENWDDYFEIKEEYLYWVENSGAVTDLRINSYLCVREPYADRARMDISKIYGAFTCGEVIKSIDYSALQNKEVIIGNQIASVMDPRASFFSLRDYMSSVGQSDYIVCWLWEGYLNAYNDNQVVVPDNINIWKMTGTLMLSPEK